MMNQLRKFRFIGIITILVLLLAACVPGFGPQLRNLNGQTWSSNFNVQVAPFNSTAFNLPVRLELTFQQRLTDVTADAQLVYEISVFRLNSGDTTLTGHLGLDGSLQLSNSNDLLRFDGRFTGSGLQGTVSIAGLVPVGDVTFTRIR